MQVVKASGKRVKFSPEKVKKTCLRAGANQVLANQVVKEIEKVIYDGIKTRDILKLILKLLKQENPAAGIRYQLKKAMLDLGPAGFVFETYTLKLLKAYHYQAWTPPLMKGACVQHEVDVIAQAPLEKNNLTDQETGKNNVYMIECKYRNAAGIRTGLKIALYTWARFLDLKEREDKNSKVKFTRPWLISNTKFSEAAVQYANCKNMRLLGWKFPQGKGLESLIEEKNLYPITILNSLDRETRNKLFSQKIILCQDLLEFSLEELKKKLKIKENKLNNLITQARLIIK